MHVSPSREAGVVCQHVDFRYHGSDDASETSEVSINSNDTTFGSEEIDFVADLSRYKSLRYSVYAFLNPQLSRRATLATAYQIFAAATIIGLFVVDSTTAPNVTTSAYWMTEFTLFFVWTMEHMLRLWSCVEHSGAPEDCLSRCKVRFWFEMKPVMLVETMSLGSLVADLCIVSNSYRGIAALRMLRLLTLYRIERDFNIFTPVVGVVRDKRRELIATAGIAALVLCIASVLMFYIEAPSNDQFNTVLMSMWWCSATLTTVGYGDIVPITPVGRFLACLVAFLGTGMFGLCAAILADGFREAVKKSKQLKKSTSMELPDPSPASQQDFMALLENRLQQHEEAAAARTALLQQEIHTLKVELLQAIQNSADRKPAASFVEP